ncbi:hypothetical protein B0H14DRAFT_3156808 [Mycena olivaceomarginata]|nr:hypothetical protein B0H14DRAFT_3156808 [Mycena olivaceomarginata]
MPPSTVIQNKLENVVTGLTMATGTLEIIADTMQTPFLGAIINTTQAVLENIQTVRKHKDDCVELLEQIHKLLNAIIILHIKSDAEGKCLQMILHRVYTFIEAQQKGNKLKSFFHQGELNTLLKDCQTGLQQSFDFFQIEGHRALTDITEIQKDAQKRHQEVLEMIEKLSEATASERASTISGYHSWASNSSKSISMLPSEPKIFHGRESELSDILHLFNTGIPRIAILGAGGMGKTSLARALLHHPEITARYAQNRFFVACSSATTKLELVNLIGGHLGLKPGKDLTQAVLQHFSNNPASLLILDELETLWEPASSRNDIEELLSLLTDITIRGAERPAKVLWTRPFLGPLQPLDQEAARRTFVDIADSGHSLDEVDRVLSLTDNMPLAISLLAHLVDTEGCPTVLSRWHKEKTSLISEGFDKRSNLDLSISLSLSSPRIQLLPHSQELLSLLSMLPDGLADVDLIQSKLPLENILKCKTVLKSTALAYSDKDRRLRVLTPIQEYLQQHHPPGDHLVQTLLKYFEEMLKFYVEYVGTQSISNTVLRVKSNFTNIQNVLQWGLKQKQPTISNSIYSTPLVGQIQAILPQLNDHRLEAYLLTESIRLWPYQPISDPESLASQALEHLQHFDDPDLKCRFYLYMANYYQEFKTDLAGAVNMCEKSISLAIQARNSRRHSQALRALAWTNFRLGKYSAGQIYAYEAQKLARISGGLYGEAEALRTQALCSKELGHYKQSLSLGVMAQSLLGLCGMSGSQVNLGIMINQAEVHKCKSEYSDAWKIHTEIARISADRDAHWHAYALLNVAEIEVLIGVPKHDVQQTVDLARSKYTVGARFTTACDATLGDLYLREKDLCAAQLLLKQCLRSELGAEMESFCLERLGNVSQWGADYSMSRWTTIFLVHSLMGKQTLQIHKALQFLGDIFLHQKDEDTANALFTVALEGFTCMDVHRSRAECMLRLGDISNRHGDLMKAVIHWNTARPLFERSSQAKEVQCIDERLACVGHNILKHHKENIAQLVELNVSSRNPSPINDGQQVGSVDEPFK